MAEVYGKPVSEAMGAFYFEALREYSWTDVLRAFRCHVKHPDQGRFFPKPADLIALLDGDTQANALEAYRVLDNALLAYGVYRSIRFEDPALTAAVQALGGWIEVEKRWRKPEEEGFLRAEFCKLYRVYVGQQLDRGAYPHHFPGLTEIENRNQYPDEPIQLAVVGLPEKKKLGEGNVSAQVARVD